MSAFSRNYQAMFLCVAAAFFLAGCAAKSASPALSAAPVLTDGQYVYSSPEDAAAAMKAAAKAGDKEELLKIFGPDAKGLMDSGDPVADARHFEVFSKLMDESSQIVLLKSPEHTDRNMAAVLVGTFDWPFPIPLVEQNGKWRFDTASGRQEIINRRIGENEILVIALFGEYLKAQREYHSVDRDGDGVLEYAPRFSSTAGRHDGLYWDPEAGQPLSPMGPLVAQAAAEGYILSSSSAPVPFHGYYFRILTSQGPRARGGAAKYAVNGKMTGGFALLAYPAKWDESGIMTFMMGPDGVVYEKNLGPDTAKTAGGIKSYDPDLSWKPEELWK